MVINGYFYLRLKFLPSVWYLRTVYVYHFLLYTLPILTYVYLQNPGAPSQIEITLVTCRDEPTVRRILVESAEQLDLKHLRKITAVCVTDPDRVMRDEAALLSSSSKEGESLSQMTTSQSDIGKCRTEVILYHTEWLYQIYRKSTCTLFIFPCHTPR